MTENPFAAGAAYVQGQYVPMHEAKISVTDWALTRSDVVYDVCHVIDGHFFRLSDHLQRFAHSMSARRLDVGLDAAEIEDVLHGVVARTGLDDAFVAMLAARGKPRIHGSRRPADCENHLIAYAIPWIDVVPKDVQARGPRLWIASHPRVPDASVDPTVKNYQWNDLTTALFEALDRGYDTAALCDAQGLLTEGPGFNVFLVHGGRVLTPDRGALHGITRRTVLELCESLGLPCEVVPIPRAMIDEASEVFLTTTAGGVMPIAQVNEGPRLPADRGEVFVRVSQAYRELHRDPRHSTPVRPLDASAPRP